MNSKLIQSGHQKSWVSKLCHSSKLHSFRRSLCLCTATPPLPTQAYRPTFRQCTPSCAIDFDQHHSMINRNKLAANSDLQVDPHYCPSYKAPIQRHDRCPLRVMTDPAEASFQYPSHQINVSIMFSPNYISYFKKLIVVLSFGVGKIILNCNSCIRY